MGYLWTAARQRAGGPDPSTCWDRRRSRGVAEGCPPRGRPATVSRVKRISPARRVALAVITLGALAAAGACSSTSPQPAQEKGACAFAKIARFASRDVGTPPAGTVETTGTSTMTVATNLGTITIEIDRTAAPCAAVSYAYLAGRHYFDGGRCNRLTTDEIYTLTCGDPKDGVLGTGPSYGFAEARGGGGVPSPGTPQTYPRGTVALVNQGTPTSNGAEFFIIYKDTELPAGAYPVFGRVTAGMGIVDKVVKGGVFQSDPDQSPTDGPTKVELTVTSVTVS
jgi:peptidyl-prolyl cis-trans isomerase B (cyclophilin B)